MNPGSSAVGAKERHGGRTVVLVILALVLLAAGAYAVAYLAASDRVPRGTTINGVDVGGKTPPAARQELLSALQDAEQEPLTVLINGETTTLNPIVSGLAVDYTASVEAAGGGSSWRPSRLWDYYTGGDSLEAVLSVDEGALSAAVEELDDEQQREPRDGKVDFVGGAIKITKPRPGLALDPRQAADTITESYLGEDTVQLELTETAPEIDEDDVREAVRVFANPALSGPVTLRFGKAPVTLSPRDYGAALALEPRDGVLKPSVDSAAITSLVENATSEAGKPVDATVALVNGKPQVIPSKPGVTFDPDEVNDTFLDLVTKPTGKRTAEISSKVDRAEFTTKDARKLRITEEVSSFSTFFPYAEYRNVNIGRAAELVDGYVLKPGETFSMNDTVGERTRANGFTEGFVISNGVFKEDLGGGVSQLATTLFNGMFFAGLEDVEHRPHSLYIDRYPIGREATVAFGALDLRFRNDTEYGVLIDTSVNRASPGGQGEVNVTMYSTKTWDITTDTSGRYNPTSAGKRTITDEDCTPTSGSGGFTIDVFRYFRKPGDSALVRKETFNTVYSPTDTVECR